jgi:DNA repair protein SbcC/Rad50
MIPIQSIDIKNFQSHKHTHLEFEEGVNALEGMSDSGKSGVVRAIIWIAFNEPLGTDFQSIWGGDTEVTLTLYDNRVIKRVKTEKGKNVYKIGRKEGKKTVWVEVFESFGTSIPIEVTDILNISKINVHQQHDLPYLLSERPLEVAKTLNEVANLDDIDTAYSKINLEERRKKVDLGVLRGEVKRITDQIENFAYLPEFENQVEKIEGKTRRKENIELRLRELGNILNKIDNLELEIGEKLKTLGAEDSLIELEEKYDYLQNLDQDKVLLERVLRYIRENLDQQKEYDRILLAETAVEKMKDKLFEYKVVKNHMSTLRSTLDSIYGKDPSDLEVQIKKMEKEFKEIFHDICPLCKQEVR